MRAAPDAMGAAATLVLTAALVLAALLVWRRARAAPRVPEAGEPAPDFRLPDQDGATRSAAEFRGRWLVLYFYPRDDTPGCIEQALRFRDAMTRLAAEGAAVCGVSVDDGARHAAFARKYRLSFPLLADVGGATAARYGSLHDFGLFRFARRNTFLIDPQGRVARVWRGASPARNADEVAVELAARRAAA